MLTLCFSCLRCGDITRLNTLAIVNTTNESLSNKSSLSERIHRMAGPELMLECKTQLMGEFVLQSDTCKVHQFVMQQSFGTPPPPGKCDDIQIKCECPVHQRRS